MQIYSYRVNLQNNDLIVKYNPLWFGTKRFVLKLRGNQYFIQMENHIDYSCLTEEEMADPILVLKKILSDGISSDLLKIDLWEWVNATLSHHQWSYHQSPDMVLYLHDYFVRLLTALHLLLLNKGEIFEIDHKDL